MRSEYDDRGRELIGEIQELQLIIEEKDDLLRSALEFLIEHEDEPEVEVLVSAIREHLGL